MTPKEVRLRLESLAEPSFQAFTSRLMPGVEPVLGVRLPKLRGIAREIARGDWRAYLAKARDDSYEETLLKGMVIGYARAPLPEHLAHVAAYVGKIDNWSTCDSFCCGLKMAAKHPEAYFGFLVPYLGETRDFPLRFGVVMLLNYFVDADHIDAVLSLLQKARPEGYYARMAVAWALSACFAAFPAETLQTLHSGALGEWVYQKAIAKILESRQVDAETKAYVRQMRRTVRRNGCAEKTGK